MVNEIQGGSKRSKAEGRGCTCVFAQVLTRVYVCTCGVLHVCDSPNAIMWAMTAASHRLHRNNISPYILTLCTIHVLQSLIHVHNALIPQYEKLSTYPQRNSQSQIWLWSWLQNQNKRHSALAKVASMLHIANWEPLTFNSPTKERLWELQHVSAWGFILNGIIDPESHLPLILPRQQGTPTVSISYVETSMNCNCFLFSL